MNKTVRGIILTLIINGAIPYLVYVLLEPHMSSFAALSIATVVPLLDNLIHLFRYRKLDVFAGVMLFTFMLGILLILMGGGEKLLLIRESFITAAVGLLFLVSLLFRRPLIYYLALRFTVADEAAAQAEFAGKWELPRFRFAIRFITLIWAVMLLAEAAVRTVLVYKLTTAQFLAVSHIVFYGFIGAAILWTYLFRRRSMRHLAK